MLFRSLIDRITNRLGEEMVEVRVEIPYNLPRLLHFLRSYGQVLSETYSERGTVLRAKVPDHLKPRFEPYIVTPKRKRIMTA